MPTPLRLPAAPLLALLALAPVAWLGACAAPSGPGADLVLVNGRIWTGDEARPWAEAVAIEDGRIVFVGDGFAVGDYIGPATEEIDLEGRFASPGFIDNHTHFNRAGELLLGVNLLEVTNAEELAAELEVTASRVPEGAWMVGGSWGAYEQWSQGSTGDESGPESGTFRPDRALIDPLTPDHPAILWNWDRSQYLANGLALEAAGVGCGTPGVECEGGEPTGRVDAAAARRIQAAIPDKTIDQRLAEARAALADLAQFGVTSFFDITPPSQVEVYQRLRERGELTARVNMRLTLDTWNEMRDAGIVEGLGDDWIRYQGLKGFVDGIMGSSQARFHEPYLTTGVRGRWRNESNTGYVTDRGSGMDPPGTMERLLFGADSAGFNPRVHAIGDEAIDSIMDLMEKVMRENPPREDRRFAIIHNQVIRGPETAARQAELGLIAEMQPYHTIDDMRWMEERIGERARWAYAFRTLRDAGVLLSFGSDWPGTNAAWYTVNPLQGIYAAVTRETLDGTPEGGWFPEEKIDVETALRAYTVNNAWVGLSEDRLGRIREGYLADLAVLDRNPFEIDPRELKDVRVDLTLVHGEVVFRR
ncbi:MAG: amidohydrolase [Longimicrobiales bacterium]|nr:amidohydrolase [Longimicrobiales bacterium]